MRKLRNQKTWIVLIAILLLLAGCKGESPTAPPPGGNPNPPGTTVPPSGSSLTLTTTNDNPLVDSTVVITATATVNGTAVPNGTAVEFASSTNGSLDGNGQAIIKTTTNGVATVTLTSSTAGAVTVTATVNNITKNVGVTFRARPVVQPPASTAPTISSVTPSIGRPQGGETIRITGTNFKVPVRVLFDTGAASPVEAMVVSVSDTSIEVITPAVNLGAGQQLAADVIVLTQAGTTAEQRVEQTGGFTFRNEQLTPVVSTATPNSGPVTGGTRVTIFGEGFQAPVQVLFGSAEARVINVDFSQIIVESPAGRDTSPNGSDLVTGPVSITVRNINSNKSVTAPEAFRYVAAVAITAVGPTEGSFAGGTRVEIQGVGFLAPVAVVIGGVAAQPISVSGTKIIAVTSGIVLTSCGDQPGPTTVTNIANGDQADGPQFTYRVPKPVIVDIDPSSIGPGDPVTVTVANPIPGTVRIKFGTQTAFVTAVDENSDGTFTYHTTAPANVDFPTEACFEGAVAGTRLAAINVDVVYTHLQSTCTDTVVNGLHIVPDDTTCTTAPPQDAAVTPTPPTCTDMGNVSSAGTTTGTANFTVTNVGGQPLIINSVAVVGAPVNVTTVTVSPTSATVAPQSSQTFTITADPAAPGAFSGTIRINSNDPDSPQIDTCFTGNGT